jgi:hypothetical protein
VLERVVKPRAGVQLGSYIEDEGMPSSILQKKKGWKESSRSAKTAFTGQENEPQTGSR